MGLLSKLFGNNDVDKRDEPDFLSVPGDRAEVRCTKTSRRVFKAERDGGNQKYSMTQYPNGTQVETRVSKHKK